MGIISGTTQQLDIRSGFAEAKLHPKSNIEMEEVRVLLTVRATGSAIGAPNLDNFIY